MAQFQRELESMITLFKLYEDKSNQSAALSEVPHEYLKAIAEAKYDSTENANTASAADKENIIRDMFLLELMDWFKNSFFSWVDSPECPYCHDSTIEAGHGTPTPLEVAHSASRVEIYTCRDCFKDNREVERFPRYNNPVVLLKTKRGRCGEWANCFALICRAVGFEVRYVRDWTDHVWVEVFSCSLKPNRWVHVDPCENSYDSPLLYSTGWGKKLTYVIGVSQDDIQDVSWRYIPENSLKEVISRRQLIGEVELVRLIMNFKNQLQQWLPAERKNTLQERMVQELVEFMYPRGKNQLKDSEKVGRETGSLAWRLARQELGDDSSLPFGEQFVWKIDGNNVVQNKYVMIYDCAKDQYSVVTKDDKREFKSGWKSGVYQTENVSRKEEKDWKKAYLAINENSSDNKGTISWQFEVTDSNLEIVGIQIYSAVSIFNEAAKISAALTDEKGTSLKLLDTNESEEAFNAFKWNSHESCPEMFNSCKKLTLSCILHGGSGATGWQHAQLFRTSTKTPSNADANRVGLKIEIDIKSIN